MGALNRVIRHLRYFEEPTFARLEQAIADERARRTTQEERAGDAVIEDVVGALSLLVVTIGAVKFGANPFAEMLRALAAVPAEPGQADVLRQFAAQVEKLRGGATPPVPTQSEPRNA